MGVKRKDYRSLSDRYRKEGRGVLSIEEVAAYAKARMPATQVAIRGVFEEISVRFSFEPKLLLDLGAGTGAGALAAREVFPSIEEAVMVESNPHMISVGRLLAEGQWIESDLLAYAPLVADCALFGYSYGELALEKRRSLLDRVFDAAQVVVIVEPGTPRGYRNVLEARDHLLKAGGHIVAPCPHGGGCPIGEGDWCHFSARLSRSKEHRALKGGQLSYEDEKFSYVAVSKQVCTPARGRVVRHPIKQKGHVRLSICDDRGEITQLTVSKKEGERYRQARKACLGAATSVHLIK